MIAAIVNSIPNIGTKRYLEIGVFKGTTFSNVASVSKTSVDPEYPATYQMTSDQFFSAIPDDLKWDVVYIDGDHHYEQALSDYNNSVDHLSEGGIIFMHDMVPGSLRETQQIICGDSFKILDWLIAHRHEREFAVLNINYGLTCIFNPQKIFPDSNQSLVTYESFLESLRKIKLLGLTEMIGLLQKK